MWPSSESLSNFKEATLNVASTRRPWSVFLDPSALTLPSSMSEAATRLTRNLVYFFFNYALLLLLVFLLTLFPYPLPFLLFFLLSAAWYFLYFSRDDLPLAILPLAFLTFAALFTTGAWRNLLLAVVIGAFLIFLHAELRSTDDLGDDDEESPFGSIFGDNSVTGGYVAV
ncbi:unnamed protein product [Sphenostylis stenocarpa]|uniref:PRA1 family protein n=1 Tax=Sphenostylis stenocarpa TaxID=92480 RepID=A0AA87B621_9FABA|nr:unnamed protein product [Sphenostylis stenocarpa]